MAAGPCGTRFVSAIRGVSGHELMKWLYHIPHVWDTQTERHVWKDVYLLPDSAPDGNRDRR